MELRCPKCDKKIGRMLQRADGVILTPCCDGISELTRIDYASPRQKQQREWDRATYIDDITQPWEVKKGEVSKGYQPNPKFIKQYKHEPDKLSMFTEKELKDSGLVTKKEVKRSRTNKYKKPKKFMGEGSKRV